MKRRAGDVWRISGLAVAAMLAAPVAAAQDKPPAPAEQPATEPEKPLTREELLQRLEALRLEMEELERTGRVRSSQIGIKTPEQIEALGAETLQAMKEGQQALTEARYGFAEERLKRAFALSEELFGQNEIWAGILHNLGVAYHNQGRIAEAEQAYGRVLEWRDEVPGRDHSDMGVTFLNLGSIYYDQGRYEEAQTVTERALNEQREKLGPDHENTLVSLGGLGTIYRAQGRFDEAERLLTEAITRSQAALGAENVHTLSAQNSLGVLYRSVGRMAEAEQLLRKTLDARGRVVGATHPDTLNSLDSLGNLYREQKRFADAEPVSERGFAGYRKVFGDEHPLTLVAAADLALTRIELGKSEQALDAARVAVAGARARRGGAGADRYTEAQRAREAASERRNYLLLADAAWGARPRGDAGALRAEAFLALQDSLGGAANEAITQMAVRRYAEQAGEGLGTLLRERIALNERWLGNMQQFARAQADASEAAPQTRAQLREERSALTERLAAVDARLMKEFPDYFALIRPQPLDLAAAQGMLGADEAILLAVPTRYGTHVMAVTREGAAWARSEWNEDRVGAAAERLRWDASGTAQGDPERVRAWLAEQRDGVLKFDRATAYALYQQLVAPVASQLEGKKRLYVAAGSALASLPFSLLVTQAPRGADTDPQALRETAWLADAYALVHIPSVQSLQLLRRTAAGRKTAGASDEGGFVGFGDPALTGPAAERRGGVALPAAQAVIESSRAPWGGAMASVSALRAMPQLPGTARELAAMRTIFGTDQAQVFTRAAATESMVRSADLSRARVIAFATHGLTPGEIVGGTRTASELFELAEPGLVLTPPEEASARDDGYLAASEVTSLKLDADWVILSACNSATPDDAAEPGLSSLARAFFYAGARNLLASHWPVDDEVGSRITVRTIALERAGTPRAEAFQQAMREIRMDKARDAAGGSWAHPFFWAPFVLIGDGGAGGRGAGADNELPSS